MRACGCWARRSFAWAMRGRRRSSAKRVSPVTFAQASTFGRRCPMTDHGRSRVSLTGAASGAGHATGGELDGVQDLGVAGAATEVAGERGADRVPIRLGRRVEQRLRGEEDPRSAVPALRGPELGKGLLEGMEPAGLGKSLDGEDLRVLTLDGERETGQDGPAVHEHRAGPALAELAAVLGPRQVELLAQYLEERPVDGHGDVAPLTVHAERHEASHGTPPVVGIHEV